MERDPRFTSTVIRVRVGQDRIGLPETIPPGVGRGRVTGVPSEMDGSVWIRWSVGWVRSSHGGGVSRALRERSRHRGGRSGETETKGGWGDVGGDWTREVPCRTYSEGRVSRPTSLLVPPAETTRSCYPTWHVGVGGVGVGVGVHGAIPDFATVGMVVRVGRGSVRVRDGVLGTSRRGKGTGRIVRSCNFPCPLRLGTKDDTRRLVN